ncbi:hypothetical protein BDA99DRAFT_600329 [Phascolomyces articulosus]|uniref:Uncharacterized protein n=1 Tax=Phascolomyces articulosus TaxID=60185 RepID=A0AAD5KCI1_9FUNG|nr:hypothetical protein BDA99DRAFT_600329 [Phascolomyces articulosus]
MYNILNSEQPATTPSTPAPSSLSQAAQKQPNESSTPSLSTPFSVLSSSAPSSSSISSSSSTLSSSPSSDQQRRKRKPCEFIVTCLGTRITKNRSLCTGLKFYVLDALDALDPSHSVCCSCLIHNHLLITPRWATT